MKSKFLIKNFIKVSLLLFIFSCNKKAENKATTKPFTHPDYDLIEKQNDAAAEIHGVLLLNFKRIADELALTRQKTIRVKFGSIVNNILQNDSLLLKTKNMVNALSAAKADLDLMQMDGATAGPYFEQLKNICDTVNDVSLNLDRNLNITTETVQKTDDPIGSTIYYNAYMIYLSKSINEALVYQSGIFGPNFGQGDLILLKKLNDKWSIARKRIVWVS